MSTRLLVLLSMLPLAWAGRVCAEPPAFDLAGPALHVSVQRAGVTLPIAQTPELAAGDRLLIEAEAPASGASPHLVVAVFLRGATDPPPRDWFTRIDPRGAGGRVGVTVTVPAGARQALLLLAPRTSGDVSTVVGAVRGRPGAFVRAAQDLTQASLDRSRLNALLAAVHRDATTGPEALAKASPLLARSLELKLNPDCLQRAPELQAACLLQGRDALVLNDGHSRSLVEAVTGGPANDLALQLSALPVGGYGATSPYIGAVLDIARMLDSLRTAQFQYIPALGEAYGDRLALILNAAPSFQNPKSVLVAALPPVEAAPPPVLHPVEGTEPLCLARDGLVLPATGAPLIFSTAFAHELRLHVSARDGRSADLPVTADADQGGLVLGAVGSAALNGPLTGVLQGRWGFSNFEGPSFRLEGVRTEPWTAVDVDGVVTGREDTARLQGPSACVDRVSLRLGTEPAKALEWKAAGADSVSATLPLADVQPGPATLLVWQHGSDTPQPTLLRLFAEGARADAFAVYAGDAEATLTGARLDQVAKLSFAGLDFAPGALRTAGGHDELALTAVDAPAAAKLVVGRSAPARIALRDGRTLRVAAKEQPARVQASLISFMREGGATGGPLQLPSADIPRGARITCGLRAADGAHFADAPVVEVSGPGETSPVSVTLATGQTELDAGVLVARLDTATFGTSAFGPLRFRVVQNGAAGNWRPLGVLVRTPTLRRLRCAPAETQPCELEGDDLFLIRPVSADPAFRTQRVIADGYLGRSLSVPHPKPDGHLYLRLHDDPGTTVAAVF